MMSFPSRCPCSPRKRKKCCDLQAIKEACCTFEGGLLDKARCNIQIFPSWTRGSDRFSTRTFPKNMEPIQTIETVEAINTMTHMETIRTNHGKHRRCFPYLYVQCPWFSCVSLFSLFYGFYGFYSFYGFHVFHGVHGFPRHLRAKVLQSDHDLSPCCKRIAISAHVLENDRQLRPMRSDMIASCARLL